MQVSQNASIKANAKKRGDPKPEKVEKPRPLVNGIPKR